MGTWHMDKDEIIVVYQSVPIMAAGNIMFPEVKVVQECIGRVRRLKSCESRTSLSARTTTLFYA